MLLLPTLAIILSTAFYGRGANAQATVDYVSTAEALVLALPPASNLPQNANHTGLSITLHPPSAVSTGASFITDLLGLAFGWASNNNPQLKYLGTNEPDASTYMRSFQLQNGFFKAVYDLGQVQRGDIIAYTDSQLTTHLMVVNQIHLNASSVIGVYQYQVTITDSSSVNHGTADTRFVKGGQIGTGEIYLFGIAAANQAGGIIRQPDYLTWSTDTGSPILMITPTNFAIGRLNFALLGGNATFPNFNVIAPVPVNGNDYVATAVNLIFNIKSTRGSNRYDKNLNSPGAISFVAPFAARTSSASFVTHLMDFVFGWDPDNNPFLEFLGKAKPNEATFFEALSNGQSQLYYPVARVGSLVIGDILVAQNSTTGLSHVMIVASLPALQSVQHEPFMPNTKQYLINIIDSANAPHGASDSRFVPGNASEIGAGVGEAIIRLYADDRDDQLTGGCWSYDNTAGCWDASTYPIFSGRLNTTLLATTSPTVSPNIKLTPKGTYEDYVSYAEEFVFDTVNNSWAGERDVAILNVDVARTRTDSFVTLLLNQYFGVSATASPFLLHTGSVSPSCTGYYSAIDNYAVDDYLLYKVKFSDLARGDILVASPPTSDVKNAHVQFLVIVRDAPVLLQTPVHPVAPGIAQYKIPIVDSAQFAHGYPDTRVTSTSGGVGSGYIRVDVDPKTGNIVAWAWDALPYPQIYFPTSVRDLRAGRFNLALFTKKYQLPTYQRGSVYNFLFFDENLLINNKQLAGESIYSKHYYIQEDLAFAVKRFSSVGKKALNTPVVSVMDKNQTAPSGDKHDYMSQAIYYWPNNHTANGLPYIRMDGHINPEAKVIPDQTNFNLFMDKFAQLSILYFYSGQLKYATAAANFFRTWFITPATRMTPNLNFGSFVPGSAGLRGQGVVEIHFLAFAMDYLELIKPSGEWTSADDAAMKAWLSEYIVWLTSHPDAIVESNRLNNHGTYYDLQLLAIAHQLGDVVVVNACIQNAFYRLGFQMDPSTGSFPRETARTRSWFYSNFNLAAFFFLAQAAEKYGIDLWNYETNQGQSLQRGLNQLLDNLDNWPYYDIEGSQASRTTQLVSLLTVAKTKWNNPKYVAAYDKLFPGIEHCPEFVLQSYLVQSPVQVSNVVTIYISLMTAYQIFLVGLILYFFYFYQFFYISGDKLPDDKRLNLVLSKLKIDKSKADLDMTVVLHENPIRV